MKRSILNTSSVSRLGALAATRRTDTLLGMGEARWRSTLPLALLLVAVLASMLLLLLAPEWLVGFHGLDDRLTAAERAKQVTEERRSILALLAATGAAVGIYYTHLRHRLDRETNQLSRDSNFTDRYTKAVEQLGHASPDVQLGGIYALERIAFDSVRDREVIRDVLSSLIREHSAPPPNNSTESDEAHPDESAIPTRPPTTVQASLTVLGRRPSDFVGGPDLSGSYLAGANLHGANLVQADLSEANLTGADLRNANLTGANLTNAILHGANLTRADLTNADLLDAHLTGAMLDGVGLTAVQRHAALGEPSGPRVSNGE
jgi:hypothetical protein